MLAAFQCYHLSVNILWPWWDDMKLYEIPLFWEPSTRKPCAQLWCKQPWTYKKEYFLWEAECSVSSVWLNPKIM
jgi:hypothetical protein